MNPKERFANLFHRLDHDPALESMHAGDTQIRRVVVQSLLRAERFLHDEVMHDGKGHRLRKKKTREAHFQNAMTLIDRLGDRVHGSIIKIAYREADETGHPPEYYFQVNGFVFDEETNHLAVMGPSQGSERGEEAFSLEGLGRDFDIEFV